MEDDIVFSRTRRLNKKRKNKRWLIILIGILVVFLLSVISAPIISQIMFTDDGATEETTDTLVDETEDDELTEDTPTEDETNNVVTEDDDRSDDVGDEDTNTDGENTSEDDITDDTTREPKNPDDYDLTFNESADENVLSSYEADWDAVPTTQAEPHTISFEQDTEDWNEMLEAATLATGIASDAMQYLWVSGNGPNKVIATYTDRESKEHFRVYIEWVENEGYTPTQVDLLVEHDQMSRFSVTSESEPESDASKSATSDDNNF